MRGFGRFSQPAALVLLSLLAGEKHGYAIGDDIERLTGERPGPGTLYGAIARLEERGLIESTGSSVRRRPYRLTDAGQAAACAEADRIAALAREISIRLRARESLA